MASAVKYEPAPNIEKCITAIFHFTLGFALIAPFRNAVCSAILELLVLMCINKVLL